MDDVCRTRDQFNYLLAAFFAGDFFFGLAFFAAAFLGFAAAVFFLSAAGFFLGEAFFFGLAALAGELGAAPVAIPLVSASSFTGERGAFPATFFGLAFLAFGFAAFFPAVAFLTVFLAGLFAFGPFAVFFGFAAFFTGLFFGEDLAGEAGEVAVGADSEVAVTGRFAALAFAGAFFGDELLARAGLFAAFGFDTLPFFTAKRFVNRKREVRERMRGQMRLEGENGVRELETQSPVPHTHSSRFSRLSLTLILTHLLLRNHQLRWHQRLLLRHEPCLLLWIKEWMMKKRPEV